MSPAGKGGVVAAVLVVAGAIGWWWLPGHAPQAPAARPATTPFPWLVATADGSASSPPAPASSPASAVVHGPGEVQVCGGAWLKLDADKSVDYAELSRALGADAAGDRLLAALHADPSVRAQGVALYLDYVKAWRLAGAARPVCNGDDCAAQASGQPALNPADALARFALTTSDPAVYNWAWRACGFPQRRDAAGACSALSLEQWAHLDPDNATPWAYLLAAAKGRGDAAAAEEAMHRIASAKRDESGETAMFQVVLDHLDDTPAGLGANLITVVGVTGMQASWAFPDHQALTGMCRSDALNDPNRRQLCDGVARTLTERSDSMLSQGMGVAIGEQAGWATDRIDRLRGERQLLYSALSMPGMEVDLGGFGGSCSDMRRQFDRFKDMVRRGPMGAMRDWVAQSGQGEADFVRAGRRIRAARAEDAASQAARRAAASAPNGSAADGAR